MVAPKVIRKTPNCGMRMVAMAISGSEVNSSRRFMRLVQTFAQRRFDLSGDDHFMYGIQTDDNWHTLTAFADD
jgi:hypothetical protein